MTTQLNSTQLKFNKHTKHTNVGCYATLRFPVAASSFDILKSEYKFLDQDQPKI